MADHNNGGKSSNPIGDLFGMVIGSVTGVYGAIFIVGGVLGLTTGNVPIQGSLLNPWETGQYAGGLFHAGANSGVQTFSDDKYQKNSKRIGEDRPSLLPNNQKQRLAPDFVPTTNRSKDASVANTDNASYEVDLNGNPIQTLEQPKKR